MSDSRVSFLPTSRPSIRGAKNQKEVNSDLQPYYDSITIKNVIFSHKNLCFLGLSHDDVINLVSKTTYSYIRCKELQNQDNPLSKPYINSRFDIFEKIWFR